MRAYTFQRYATSTFFSLTMAFVVGNVGRAENWPGWRGPRGDGTSLEKDVPLHWNGKTGDNIAWKTSVDGEGHASPIVWGNRVFLVSCFRETAERALLCFDRQNGKKIWQRVVVQGPLETKHNLNSFASSTPATDGEFVYVAFLEVDGSTITARNVSRARPVTPGQMVVAAYDFDGKPVWIVRPGGFVSVHGFCSCPVLFEDLVIVNGDHDGESYIVALDRRTGRTRWKVERENKTRSYVTPIIRNVAGRAQMVLSGNRCIVSYNPRDGSRHWEIDGPTEQFVASMVYDGELFFMAAGFPTYHVMALRPDGRGDVSDTHVRWHVKNVRCYVPSPVVEGKYLLVADDRGTANCFDTASGERLWRKRLGTHYSASLVTAKGMVFFLADNGIMKVVRPGPELEIMAENPLGDYCFASPAIAEGQIFVRSEKNLFCIGQATTGN